MIAFNTFSRKSKILRYFKNKLARIYKGHGWKTVHFKRAFVGYKLGEFTRTRQLALFRSKTLKKKMKMRKLSVYHNIKISKIKTLKASKLRKNRLLTKSGEVAL